MENSNEKETPQEPEMVWMYIEDWIQHDANVKEVQKLIGDGTDNTTSA